MGMEMENLGFMVDVVVDLLLDFIGEGGVWLLLLVGVGEYYMEFYVGIFW